jgi:hypothetical protein
MLLTLLTLALAQPAPTPAAAPATPVDWKSAEAPLLSGHIQLTFPEKVVRAGEAYFDHQNPPQWIVFQAIPVPAAGQAADANYSMYVAKLKRDDKGEVTGLDEPVLISPPGSANTCGWFSPKEPGVVVFGSTLVAPKATDTPGYSKDRQRYSWQFPPEMEVVRCEPLENLQVCVDVRGQDALTEQTVLKERKPKSAPLFSRPGYDAEGSFSSDGRFYLYTHVDPTNNDPNIWVYDTLKQTHTPIVTARGYDGGPFFSPDNKWICYRSDRKGDNNLQLFIGELARGSNGDADAIIGLAREIQLTDDADAVSWCPYWHPSGKYLVYASSLAGGHSNYEVMAIEIDPSKKSSELRRARVTNAPGFDGLPCISDDGSLMMWTSQRGPKLEREQRPSSQLWIAKLSGEPAWNKK